MTDTIKQPAEIEQRTFHIRYWPVNQEPPKGWVRHDGLSGTHHGQYSCFITPKGQKNP